MTQNLSMEISALSWALAHRASARVVRAAEEGASARTATEEGRPRSPSRTAVSPKHPHHVTVRVRSGTWNLRSQRGFSCLATALREVRARPGFRVVHYSVQGNHVHMLVEGDDRRAMSNGLRAVLIRFAKRSTR